MEIILEKNIPESFKQRSENMREFCVYNLKVF